ncbi:GDSL esterase/lipase EXL3-like isoform X1 [Impatiens glandulifera]|uniref:GDSL esterase/lipase EXL3-like isoform X1 n=1 Tax=Impatiens glandulifera TaxID=253017 RepID=UPI001FB0533A|nr:GDSL esterase/lipase EXL3-like isoform X1 [Impatiens glandulifera]
MKKNRSSSFTQLPISVLINVFLPLWLMLLVSGIVKMAAAIILPANVSFPAVFVFGDSLVDNGNNNALLTLVKCNFPPYGRDFQGGFPTGRFSNGKTPPDIIAEELGIKDIVPAYLDPKLQPKDLTTGVTFASGGSGWDPQTPLLALVYTMEDQMNHFKEYIGKLREVVGEEKTCFILANSFFVIVAGSNDITNTYYSVGLRRLQYDINSYSQFLAQSASQFVQGLYELGARRIGVFGVPPLGCLPSQRTTIGVLMRECLAEYNQASEIYSDTLSSTLASLSLTLDTNARIVYMDLYNPILDIIQNAQQYGFDVVDKGCCGTGLTEVTFTCNPLTNTCGDDTKYLFWDAYHPTERGYRIIIRQLLQKYLSKLY